MKSTVTKVLGAVALSAFITLPAHAVPLIWESDFGTDLGLGDDSTASIAFGFTFAGPLGSFTGGVVSSNGFIRLAASTPSLCCDGVVSEFLSGDPMIAPAWYDIKPPVVYYKTFADRVVVTVDFIELLEQEAHDGGDRKKGRTEWETQMRCIDQVSRRTGDRRRKSR